MTIPYTLPPVTKLGSVYRGDTVPLPVWVAQDPRTDEIIDLGGATIWFTAKERLTDPDGQAPGFQISLISGDITVIDDDTGEFQVTIPASATINLETTIAMLWDCQVRTTGGIVSTIKRGTISINADVTQVTA